jgi:hypothetical protein
MFAVTRVHDTPRRGALQLGGRRFLLRRVYLPEKPTAEWFIVDLLEHHDMAGVGLSALRCVLPLLALLEALDALSRRGAAERR